ncbi:MAG: peptidyl-prolyl cis-trans isomerase SurA [Desulforhopalus sp.]|jgi:peptidyl-prolyl cis-trans isomerase SurA
MKHLPQASKMKTYAQCCIVALFFWLQTSVNSTAEMVDKIVAVVNDDIITLSELENETTGIYKTLANNKSPENLLEAMDEARELALNKMIDRTLMEQKAKQFNLSVSEAEIDSAFERTKSNMSLDSSQFRQKLKKSGLSEEQYRNQLRDNILQSKILSVDVRSKIVITDEMVLDYYDQHYTSRVNQGDYYLLQMGFSWKEDPQKDLEQSKNKTLKIAKRIHNLVTGGQDFKTLAKKFSDLPSASDGGDIGIFTLDEMAPAMQSAVKDLKPGELSSIIELQSGYQFFKLLSGEDEAIVVTSSLESSKGEIRDKLYESKMKEAYKVWVKNLKESAYIQKL